MPKDKFKLVKSRFREWYWAFYGKEISIARITKDPEIKALYLAFSGGWQSRDRGLDAVIEMATHFYKEKESLASQVDTLRNRQSSVSDN